MGRAGHHLHDTVKGRIIVLDRDDLIECSVLLKNALEHKIDTVNIPQNCLDVMAQHIFGAAIAGPIGEKELFSLIRKSYCYRDLNKVEFDEVIKYLAGYYSSLETRYVYAKIWFDEETGMIGKRGKLARVLYMTNIGTIPDEARVRVKMKDFVLGTVDEVFVERLRKGDVFVLGGQKYAFKFSRGMTIQVAIAGNRPPTVPNWVSEMLPLSFDLAMSIQAFRRLLEEKFRKGRTKKEILQFIHDYVYVDSNAAEAIYSYFSEQFDYLEIPHDKKIVVEMYNEGYTKHAIFHSVFGRRTNDALSRAFAYLVGRLTHKDVEIVMNDNGFVLTASSLPISQCLTLFKKNDLRQICELSLDKGEVLNRRFRHCATRALMILRNYRGRTKTVGRQQASSRLLLYAVQRIDNNFPILKEARREVLEDLMDIKAAEHVISLIVAGKIKIVERQVDSPSPFAFNVFAQGYSDVLKMEGRLDSIKRMHEKVMKKLYEKQGLGKHPLNAGVLRGN
jgi:ATP-dependent helicase Lhr and Lhr-like helicase